MMEILLSIIVVCLVLITANLYLRTAGAEVDGMNFSQLRLGLDFRRAVQAIVEDCRIRTERIRC